MASGNTFGAVFWTDGYIDAPMLPHYPGFVKCPVCGKIMEINNLPKFWREKPSIFDEEGLLQKQPAPSKVQDPLRLSIEEYLSLAKRLRDFGKIKNTIINAWWLANHPARENPQAPHQLSGPLYAALERLLPALLKDPCDEQSRLMGAEILRETGAFKACLTELKQTRFSRVRKSKILIRRLALKKDSRVQAINPRPSDYWLR